MKTHKLIVEITTTTNIPLDVLKIQEAIMNIRSDIYVNLRVDNNG